MTIPSESRACSGSCLSGKFNFAMSRIFVMVVVSAAICELGVSEAPPKHKVSLRMPDITPDYPDQNLCLAYRLPEGPQGQLLTGFTPFGNSSRVHHMLVHGCRLPGIYQPDAPSFVWDCSSMRYSNAGQGGPQRSFESGPACQGEEQILYAWALDAKPLKLPDGIGFKVGGDTTNIKYLVLQVHYHGNHNHKHDTAELHGAENLYRSHVAATELETEPMEQDNSGFELDVKRNEPASGITKQAGVLVLISDGYVELGKSRHEIFCPIEDDIEIHPFRFRVHTHKLGTRVTGSKLARRSYANNDRFSIYAPADGGQEVGQMITNDYGVIIGEKNPQEPEMFYPVQEKDLVLRKGDMVHAACDFNNKGNRNVLIGPSGKDEMCNFYLMYWTDGPNILNRNTCRGINPRDLQSRLLEGFQ